MKCLDTTNISFYPCSYYFYRNRGIYTPIYIYTVGTVTYEMPSDDTHTVGDVPVPVYTIL